MTLKEALEIAGIIAGILLVLGSAIAVILYGAYKGLKSIRGEVQSATDERVAPWKEAAEGWRAFAEFKKARLEQLEAEMKSLREENAQQRKDFSELHGKYEMAMSLNLQLQSEVDSLTKRVKDLEQKT